VSAYIYLFLLFPLPFFSLHNPFHNHNHSILIIIIFFFYDCITDYPRKRLGRRPSATMATQPNKKTKAIFDQFEAIRIRIAALTAGIDTSFTKTITGPFLPGEGMLAQLRPVTKKRMREDGDLSSSSEEEDSFYEEEPARPVRKLDQQYTDDPNREGLLGEDEGAGYLQSLNTLVVSPSPLC
jgi:hypothetical protein